MISEKELDMNDLINSFDECSTDYTKTACTYYGDYLRNYQKEKIQLQNNWNELKKWLEEVVDYEEYDKIERDTLKKILNKMQE